MQTALTFLLTLACPLGIALMGAFAWTAAKLGRRDRRG
jgi:hypothetical protein